MIVIKNLYRSDIANPKRLWMRSSICQSEIHQAGDGRVCLFRMRVIFYEMF